MMIFQYYKSDYPMFIVMPLQSMILIIHLFKIIHSFVRFFARHQSFHLGLTNITSDNSNDQLLTRNSFQNETTPVIEYGNEHSKLSTTILPTSVLKYENAFYKTTTSFTSVTTTVSENLSSTIVENINSSFTQSIRSNSSDENSISTNQSEIYRPKRSTSSKAASTIITPTQTMANVHSDLTLFALQSAMPKTEKTFNTSNKTAKSKKKMEQNNAIIGHVKVLIHNISVINESYEDQLDEEITLQG